VCVCVGVVLWEGAWVRARGVCVCVGGCCAVSGGEEARKVGGGGGRGGNSPSFAV
jgi:hypothetical protein